MQELEKILEEIEIRAIKDLEEENDRCSTTCKGCCSDVKERKCNCRDAIIVRAFKKLAKCMNDDWIPVDDRLPKTNGTYNVTRHIDGHFISDSAYFDGQNTWHSDNRVNHSRPYLTDVIAWRPLPEPYKPERSEEE